MAACYRGRHLPLQFSGRIVSGDVPTGIGKDGPSTGPPHAAPPPHHWQRCWRSYLHLCVRVVVPMQLVKACTEEGSEKAFMRKQPHLRAATDMIPGHTIFHRVQLLDQPVLLQSLCIKVLKNLPARLQALSKLYTIDVERTRCCCC